MLRDFISRLIQPLQQWVNFGFEYLGAKDPSRMSAEELSGKEVLQQLWKLLKNVEHMPIEITTFCAAKPPPVVRLLFMHILNSHNWLYNNLPVTETCLFKVGSWA